MADRKRRDQRASVYRQLNEQRGQIQALRMKMIRFMRSSELGRDHKLNSYISELTGIKLDYTGKLRDAVWLIDRLAPDWELINTQKVGQFYRLTMQDRSDEHRGEITNKFVSENPMYVLIYLAMTLHLTDINGRIEDIPFSATNIS